MSLNLGTILQASTAQSPDATVLKLGDTRVTYAELDRSARGVAAQLRDRGVEPGDRVALLIPNVPEFTTAYFGILYAGAAVVPINVLAAAPEVTYFIEDSSAQLLIAHPLFAEPAQAGAEAAGVPLVIAGGGEGPDTLEAMVAAEPIEAPYPTDADDTAVILYTSGTTGKPKGAELSHSNLFVNCAVVVPRLLPAAAAANPVALATLPLFHSFGQTCIQNATIAAGGMFVLLPRFTPAEALDLLERERITIFAGVPTMYIAMLNHRSGEGDEREYDVSSLECCMTGGAPMPLEVAADRREVLERRLRASKSEAPSVGRWHHRRTRAAHIAARGPRTIRGRTHRSG